MRRVSGTEIEWNEFCNLLNSPLLTRSPSLLKIAEYIGRKYFAGEGESLKEYTIAVEALGKPAEFDPKRDSIVRVEVHRLRRKVKEYYRTDGAGSRIQIVLEPGQYVPKFVPIPAEPAAEIELDLPEIVAPDASEPAVRAKPGDWRRRFWLPVALVLTMAAIFFAAHSRAHVSDSAAEEIRLLAGVKYGPMASSLGEAWAPEPSVRGGHPVFGPELSTIPGAADVPLNAQRQGNFDYDIPLKNTVYELRLYFAPRIAAGGTVSAAVATRRFNVFANGRKILDALDPCASHPQTRWIVRAFRGIKADRDGKLHLSFRSGADPAYVNAIKLTRGQGGRTLPIRIVAKAAPYREPNGRVWGADRYVSGGSLAMRSERVKGSPDPNLYSGERYGSFTYDIPLPAGKYGLRLYFAETWFGPGFGGGGVGSRRFDVNANGVPLLQDFDIFRETGGSHRSVVREFHGLSPDADGYISLAFVPRVNNACVNALEIFDETR